MSKGYQLTNDDGSITINGVYTLPNVDGTIGQAPVTDGIGGLTWGSPSPVLTADGIAYGDGSNLMTSDTLATRDADTKDTVITQLQDTTNVRTATGTIFMAPYGEFTGPAFTTYTLTIDGTGSPNTFSWSDGIGGSGSNVPINTFGVGNVLSEGLIAHFTAQTGGVMGDSWTWVAAGVLSGFITNNVAGGSGQAHIKMERSATNVGGYNGYAKFEVFDYSGAYGPWTTRIEARDNNTGDVSSSYLFPTGIVTTSRDNGGNGSFFDLSSGVSAVASLMVGTNSPQYGFSTTLGNGTPAVNIHGVDNTLYTWPATVGGAGDVLTDTSGNGTLAWTTPAVTTSGVYTPTAANNTNLDSNPVPSDAQWMQVGNVVTVSGEVTAVDPTTTLTATAFTLSLPVASNFITTTQAGGTAYCGAITGQGAAIQADVTNDVANIFWVATDVTSQTWSYHYTYLIT